MHRYFSSFCFCFLYIVLAFSQTVQSSGDSEFWDSDFSSDYNSDGYEDDETDGTDSDVSAQSDDGKERLIIAWTVVGFITFGVLGWVLHTTTKGRSTEMCCYCLCCCYCECGKYLSQDSSRTPDSEEGPPLGSEYIKPAVHSSKR